MNATTQVQSMTIWWMFLVLYDHQVVYVNWFPMHLQDESCQAIGRPNLVVWLELEVMLTFHHHHYMWWTLMCCGNDEHGKLWGRYKKWNRVHHLLFCKDYVMNNLHQCTSFLLANWTLINGRFFFRYLSTILNFISNVEKLDTIT
jgi:hypothetical protein